MKSRLSIGKIGQAALSEHAVIVHLPLQGGHFGGEDEQETVRALERRIEAALETRGVGELDGDEFGGDEVVLYAYGPDADVLFGVIEPLVRESSLLPASAILRYGDVDDSSARARRVEIKNESAT
ncbi:hypothetical protein [Actinokineospora enzanensis]|uniref:hypothetical protein n=1 Tax=Actinokineospora enzanensis TaxID=155975 RepID=UPI000476EA95|nr:hypothetical protein [Actinokineospora enzanensis]